MYNIRYRIRNLPLLNLKTVVKNRDIPNYKQEVCIYDRL